ncbi:sodium- and chloride-dependent neutral and basic amino acid transporter B(0+)-like isoform X2 [Siniperca chuatsi]|uniref:sodium- and chloride-dependent neutral and basic amino acid transporter B(0+)-like isoform X2 n=1 Tax=Siniperca chuatsi TaxID=119488 RepID=UPI001CE1BB0F|nr:sodium- and chloride-dependent neutral and basic amino acid transporter B(0+)-like isoform X2 [Siniperca chuatsi]
MWNCGSNISKDPAIPSDQDSHVDDGDENPERGNWTNKTESMLSMIGYAIGLGNIWRFPYLAYRNGGGAFLIPYFLMLVLCGTPLFFLESAISQFCSQGPISIWRAVPILQVYCNVSGVLVANWTQENSTCPSSDMTTVPVQSPSEQYWDRVALQRSSGLDETGPVVWHLALCLLLSSTLVAAALIRGIKSSGKVMYFTSTFPYVVIVILLIRGVTLEGARDGIEFFIGSQSNWTTLTEGQVWKDAATQTIFSLSIASGGILTLASYSNFHNNMFLDAVIVTFINHGTSVFAGFAIFSILGHMAHIYGKPVGEVVKEGFGLVFIAYPDALAKLPISPLWSILFFLMLLILGLDTQFTHLEVLTTCLLDAFPEIFKPKRALMSITTCYIIYLLGLPCVTRAGIYWANLIDQFVTNWLLLILALIEVIGFCYIYGGNRFIKDVEMMIGKKSFCFWLWWRACWFFVSPCIIVVVLVWSLITFVPPTYGKVEYPDWGMALGWCMVMFILIWIPVVAVYKLMRAKGSPCKRLKSLCSPSEDWHPYLNIHRGERYSEDRCHQRRAVSTNDKQM